MPIIFITRSIYGGRTSIRLEQASGSEERLAPILKRASIYQFNDIEPAMDDNYSASIDRLPAYVMDCLYRIDYRPYSCFIHDEKFFHLVHSVKLGRRHSGRQWPSPPQVESNGVVEQRPVRERKVDSGEPSGDGERSHNDESGGGGETDQTAEGESSLYQKQQSEPNRSGGNKLRQFFSVFQRGGSKAAKR